ERDRLGVWMPWVLATTVKNDERVWLETFTQDPPSPAARGIWGGSGVEGGFGGGMGIGMDPFGITAEIGYWIRSRFEGKGFVTRGCEALIDYAFDAMGVPPVLIRRGG